MKTKTESECLTDLQKLVTETKELKKGAKIVISLPPNRGDSPCLNHKTNIINATVKSIFAEDRGVFVCDNSNLSYRGEPDARYICNDGVHPTPAGKRVLFGNIRQAIARVLIR
ncbi:hypothetical protein FSP39_022741 [Pinctada imbricata]|uniref:Uncharacterized protein n=1 Tax=Pinctada imbricata TaxID=66713 RepID=A0AA88YWA3_PINIB|nr:hypothetical protein FSP39_022741 [Pinctada imbricata]